MRAVAPVALVTATVFSAPRALANVNGPALFARVPRTVHGVPLRARGYIPDNCLVFDVPCLAISGSGRYRPEATAQSKILRALSWAYGDALSPGLVGAQRNQVMWEAAPGPDSQYAPDWQNPNDPIPDPPSPGCRYDVLVDYTDQSKPPGILEVRRYSSTADTDLRTLIDGRYTTCAQSWGLPVDPTTGRIHRDSTLNVQGWSRAYLDNLGQIWCVWADDSQSPGFYGQAYFELQPATPPGVQVKTPGCHGDPQNVPVAVAEDDPNPGQSVAVRGTASLSTPGAVPGGRVSVQAAGLLANEVYSVKFADGNDVAHGVACSKAASIAGVQSDGSGSVASTYAFLPTSAQQNGNGLICFVHAPRNEETTPAVSIAVRSLSEVKVSDDGGGGQTTTSGSVAASALRVVLTDASNNPVHGYVTFSAPSSGPSATFAPIDPDGSAGRSIRVITGDDGAGVSSPFTAGSAGAYVVAATAEGTSSSVNFAETNSPPISQGGGC